MTLQELLDISERNGMIPCPGCQKDDDIHTMPYQKRLFRIANDLIDMTRDVRNHGCQLQQRWTYHYKRNGKCYRCCLHWLYNDSPIYHKHENTLWYEEKRNTFGLTVYQDYNTRPKPTNPWFGACWGRDDIVEGAEWK